MELSQRLPPGVQVERDLSRNFSMERAVKHGNGQLRESVGVSLAGLDVSLSPVCALRWGWLFSVLLAHPR